MTQQLSFLQDERKTCAFTGHRVLNEDFSVKELKNVIKEVILRGVETFYVGMATGFDLCAAETTLALKRKYKQIKLIACIPCCNQEKYYSAEDKKRYAKIIKKVDEKVFLSEHYYNGCMQNRDRYMADRADIMIVYLKKKSGGTAYTVHYFENKYPTKEKIFL